MAEAPDFSANLCWPFEGGIRTLRPSGYESLQGRWVPADLQGFRETTFSYERTNLLVLVPVWYPFSGKERDPALSWVGGAQDQRP